jgi:hypothetical protein
MKMQKLKPVQGTMIVLCISAGASLAPAQSVQPTYPSTAEATKSLVQAVQSNDEQAILQHFGSRTRTHHLTRSQPR